MFIRAAKQGCGGAHSCLRKFVCFIPSKSCSYGDQIFDDVGIQLHYVKSATYNMKRRNAYIFSSGQIHGILDHFGHLQISNTLSS
jgi:hypothetical protein